MTQQQTEYLFNMQSSVI